MANKIDNIVTPYNTNEIITNVKDFSVTRSGNIVSTFKGQEQLKSTEVSDRYKMFDFSDFVSGFIPQVQDVFTPQAYSLKLAGGKQELKLKGDTVTVNGEEWNKMVWILNSTDKSRSLQMSMGLFRVVCSNGMIASAPGSEMVSFKVKHLTSNDIPTKVQTFLKGLERADEVFNSSVNLYEGLVGSKMTVGQIGRGMGLETPTQIRRFEYFTKKLANSVTDRLGGLEDAQIKGLNLPLHRMSQDIMDIEVDKYQALQCFTEIYRNRDAGKIQRETQRIVDVLTA